MGKIKEGEKFGRWTVLGLDCIMKQKQKYKVICDCGAMSSIVGSSLRTGNSKSCGCLNREVAIAKATKHGLRYNCLYQVWNNMMARCYRKNTCGYPLYGARGISVCDRWHKVENFIEDLSPMPDEKSEIDRIDNDGNYEPSNVRWVSRKENARNTRKTIFVEYQGRRMCLGEAAEISGIGYDVLRGRYRRGSKIFRDDEAAK